MKHLLPLLLLLATTHLFAQKDKIQKSWIKTSVENLSNRPTQPDTLYTRYTFEKNDLNISFSPCWNYITQTWSIKDKNLSLGFDNYIIETLNDTALTIALEGFRRYKFLSESYLSSKLENLDSIGDYKGKLLFKANNYITPRYTGKGDFRALIEKGVKGYQVVKASYFLATFIVTEEGNIENVKVVKSISESFDKEIVNQLLKTSKKWKPASFNGKPIQTEAFYDIKYLNSLSINGSGTVH
jgi:hypothetical protein